ncbi:hypothetical protein EXIGLDRAFT_116961 [Exidia glandulosa HHB12029]|uniref:Uncharacterized protein n=1 Tax=Exidia glandulosa HHB12029 TaxID=1314781 RepID=A0A166MAK0_EXIGL|nr:hypothetical protein EXIGLDRAFT_116961 [Exidia glandulosa HHB12029]
MVLISVIAVPSAGTGTACMPAVRTFILVLDRPLCAETTMRSYPTRPNPLRGGEACALSRIRAMSLADATWSVYSKCERGRASKRVASASFRDFCQARARMWSTAIRAYRSQNIVET